MISTLKSKITYSILPLAGIQFSSIRIMLLFFLAQSYKLVELSRAK